MREHDSFLSTFGDRRAPSPRPNAFVPALLGDDISSRSMLEYNNDMLYPGQNLSGRNDEKENLSGGLAGVGITRLDMYSKQKMNSPIGLLERMAARAGFNVPKLNTEGVRPNDLPQNQDAWSSFLTIPSGLSPTTLLESPVLLTNAMVQPSPTRGNIPFSFGSINSRTFSLGPEDSDIGSKNIDKDLTTSFFKFKPIPESRNSSFLGPTNNNFPGFEVSRATSTTENSSPPNHQKNEELYQPLPGATLNEDGYNWRKYGQKQVKGSEYPRSYYKCTHSNYQVKRKVSQEENITEIIHIGDNIHPESLPSGRPSMFIPPDTQSGISDHNGIGHFQLRYGDVVDGPSAFSTDEQTDEDHQVTQGSSLDDGGEEDESEFKRRKTETYAADVSGLSREIREPKVVIHTISEVDVLDDGYHWRKYGQKILKGNPNPRSYYRCTHTGCTVRKHIERASHDLNTVVTAYERKHNHEVPAARNSSQTQQMTTNQFYNSSIAYRKF